MVSFSSLRQAYSRFFPSSGIQLSNRRHETLGKSLIKQPMYFSGYPKNELCTIDSKGSILLNQKIADIVSYNKGARFRVSFDMPSAYLKHRPIGFTKMSDKLILRSKALLGLDAIPSLVHVDYISNMLIRAVIRQMTPDDFKETYLLTLESILQRVSNILQYVPDVYYLNKSRRSGDPSYHLHISQYFNF